MLQKHKRAFSFAAMSPWRLYAQLVVRCGSATVITIRIIFTDDTAMSPAYTQAFGETCGEIVNKSACC